MVYDNCIVVDSPQSLLYCKIAQPFQPQFKFQAAFGLPWGLQTSATWQNLPGNERNAIYTATNEVIAPSLQRNLAAGANATVPIDLIPPMTQFEDRINQFDGRIGKTLRFGRTRVQANFDVYNLFNANPVLSLNQNYGSAWLTPTSILAGRLFKISAQLDF